MTLTFLSKFNINRVFSVLHDDRDKEISYLIMKVLIIFQVIFFHQGKICLARDHVTIFLLTDYCYIFCDLHPIKMWVWGDFTTPLGNSQTPPVHPIIQPNHDTIYPIQIPQDKDLVPQGCPIPIFQMPIARSAYHLCFLPDGCIFQIPMIPSLGLIICWYDPQNAEKNKTFILLDYQFVMK